MATNSAKPLIFLVENDPAWVAVIESKIGSKYDKKDFPTGEEALENLNLKPSIIVLDYHLDGQMTGLDTLKQFQKRYPEAKVIMMSAQEDIQTAVDILNNGAYDYIVKGDSAVNRLKIVLRNIEREQELTGEVITLRLQVKRERLALYAVLALIAVISLVIYLRVCPDQRIIKMDPFGMQDTEDCTIIREAAKARPQ